MKWGRKHLLLAGLAVIAVSNAIALGGAAYNRDGEAESVLKLSERELQPVGGDDARDNSGLSLRIEWRALQRNDNEFTYLLGGSHYGASPEWLGRDKMASLGFESPRNDWENEARRYRRGLSHEVFLVLELDGDAARESAARALAMSKRMHERGKPDDLTPADQMLRNESTRNSRLFVIDAGLDAAPLRVRYPDRAKYAIVTGRIAPSAAYKDDGAGYLTAINVSSINVPLEHRSFFLPRAAALRKSREAEGAAAPAAGFEATVAFGRRLEPWLVSVRQ